MFDPLYPKSLGSQVPNRTFDSVPKEDQTVLVEDNVEEAASDVVESIAPCAPSGEEIFNLVRDIFPEKRFRKNHS